MTLDYSRFQGMNAKWWVIFRYPNWPAWVGFALVFLFFTYPMGLSDYWWHMNSGRWIVENQQLPWTDPFTFTTSQNDDLRKQLILRAYYLGQIGFYALYDGLGIWGLLLLKAGLLTLSFWLLWRFLLLKQVHPLVALTLILPLPLLLYRFDELRPVLFSFIGCLATLLLVEKILASLRQEKVPWRWIIVWFAGLLFWANLHRGFVIAWVLIGAYVLSESYRYWYLSEALSPQSYRRFLGCCLLGIMLTLLNPNGIDAIFANQAELAGPFINVVDEYFSLWAYTTLYGNRAVFYASVLICLGAAFYMIKYWRKSDGLYPLLALGFGVQGFATFRFSYFLITLLPAFSAAYFQADSVRLYQRRPRWVWAAYTLALIILGGMAIQRTALINGPWERAYFPTGAAYFLQQHRPPGNLFNAFEYGGYLAWQLAPDKVFIDQRNLDFSVYQDYQTAITGGYNSVFEKYAINSVIFYNKQPVLDRPAKLVTDLLRDPQWSLVYFDRTASVLVRKQYSATLPQLDKHQAKAYLTGEF